MLQGCLTALVTPFKNGGVDWESLERLVHWQIESGVHGLVPCGTTGESPTLTQDEHLELVRRVVKLADGRIPVLAGCGSNSTIKTIEMARAVSEAGATSLLVVTPYYNRPTQRGLYEHYAALAKAVNTPICIYNVPTRTAVNIEPDTVLALAREFPHIIAIKESSAIMDQASRLCRESPNGFDVLSGDDSLTLPMLSIGASGVVSVVSNVAPREMAQLTASWDQGDWDKARRLHQKLFPIFKAFFIESNPGPVKWALHHLGLITSPEMRPPMAPLDPANASKIFKALEEAGIKAKIK